MKVSCLLHATDITKEISSFGGAINNSLELYTGLSLGRPAGLIPSTSQSNLICLSSSRSPEKQLSAEQHFHFYSTSLLFYSLSFGKSNTLNCEWIFMPMADMRGINTSRDIGWIYARAVQKK